MAYENGVDWRPEQPHLRGRHGTFSSALDGALSGILVEKNPFFDSLVRDWSALFPSSPLRPGRYERGTLYLYVRSAPARFAVEPRMANVRRRICSLEGAPPKLKILLEIHP